MIIGHSGNNHISTLQLLRHIYTIKRDNRTVFRFMNSFSGTFDALPKSEGSSPKFLQGFSIFDLLARTMSVKVLNLGFLNRRERFSKIEHVQYLSQKVAQAIDEELMGAVGGFSVDQLMELGKSRIYTEHRQMKLIP